MKTSITGLTKVLNIFCVHVEVWPKSGLTVTFKKKLILGERGSFKYLPSHMILHRVTHPA